LTLPDAPWQDHPMNTLTTSLKSLAVLVAATSVAVAQVPSAKTSPPTVSSSPPTATTATSPATTNAQPSAAEMQYMMEMSKLNENHKLLAGMVGTWSYSVTMWMAPGAPPNKSTGTAVCKAIMDGRYFTTENTGSFKMPGADGKMKDMAFKGIATDGYDNTKKKFVSSWIDNMGTGIMMSEGTYDPATKTLTYTSEYDAMPGVKSKVRQTLKITDANHHTLEFFEDRGAGETKTMEIDCTRKK
jgi:Protein of unknown function (DUF1579)